MLILKRIGNNLFNACLVSLATLSCLNSYAQKSIPDIRITLDVNGLSLEETLEAISQKSGIPFSYNPRKIPTRQKINYKAMDKPLSTVLDELSALTGLKYVFVEDQIILKPEKRSDKKAGEDQTLSGYVKDGGSGEALIGATIFVKELQTGTVSNGFGFYSLTVPKGKYEITYSFVGYSATTKVISLNAKITEDVGLAEGPVLKEIVVSGLLPEAVKEIQTGKIDLRSGAVEERPALFGEMDVVKSLESLPGFKLHSDGSTFYYVRGGNRDQNLILIDDAPIYNPSHMLGVFSTILPDVVNDISIYKGSMPASLGGRLSSVVSVRTRKGNDQHLQVWGNLGLISTKLGIEGPIKKNASSFILSGRMSRLKWLFQKNNADVKQFYFSDFTGKVNFRLNKSNRIFYSLYTGSDNYFSSNNGLQWANTAGTFRWNHLFNDCLFLNTTVSASAYDYFLYTDVASNTKWHSHISNFNLKTDFTYFIKPQNELTFGASLDGYNFNPGNLQTDNHNTQLPVLSVRNSVEGVLYANHEIRLDNHWGLNYGLRLTSWTNTGEAFEFVFDQNRNPMDTLYFKKGQNYKTYYNAEPRMTVSYFLGEKASIKAGFSRNIQNIHLISNSISPFTSMEVWLPSSINIKPEAANQVTLGYYRSLPRSRVSLVAEMFYKKMTNQIDYNPHAETLLNPLVERELRFGMATAYGAEFLVKKDEGRLRGWAGYSYSRAKRKFKDINDGKEFNAFYDRPHQVNLVLAYDISVRWNLGVNWNYYTGSPFSSPVSFYAYNGQEIPVYGQKNNDRLPDYHRMDMSATLKLNKNPEKKFRHTLTFSIYNLYGRANPLFVNYNKTQLTDGTFKIPSNLLNGNREESQFLLFRVTPSLTYNFKWL